MTLRFTLLAMMCIVMIPGCGRSSTDDPGTGQAESPAVDSASEDREAEALRTILENAPETARQHIREDPAHFLDLLGSVLAGPDILVRIVDREHPLAPDYEPEDLVSLDDYSDRLILDRSGHRLRAVALPALETMSDAAREAGVTLVVASVYRSYEYQETVYQYWVDTLGQEEADVTSARPGTSQHQLGTTIDFGCICEEFADGPAGRWLAENAWRYGFTLSYPNGLQDLTGYQYESWHFRYIGREAATMQHEFFGDIQHTLLVFLDHIRPVAARLLGTGQSE